MAEVIQDIVIAGGVGAWIVVMLRMTERFRLRLEADPSLRTKSSQRRFSLAICGSLELALVVTMMAMSIAETFTLRSAANSLSRVCSSHCCSCRDPRRSDP
jgi:hypothetical protein